MPTIIDSLKKQITAIKAKGGIEGLTKESYEKLIAYMTAQLMKAQVDDLSDKLNILMDRELNLFLGDIAPDRDDLIAYLNNKCEYKKICDYAEQNLCSAKAVYEEECLKLATSEGVVVTDDATLPPPPPRSATSPKSVTGSPLSATQQRDDGRS